MKISRLARLGKKVVDRRGGVEGLKHDAAELKKAAQGEGTLKDKAKRATEALRDTDAKRHADEPGPGGDEGRAQADSPSEG